MTIMMVMMVMRTVTIDVGLTDVAWFSLERNDDNDGDDGDDEEIFEKKRMQ